MSAQLPFGETHIFSDGSTLVAEKPVDYMPEFDYGVSVPDTLTRVEVTFTNNSEAPLDAGSITAAATFGGQPADPRPWTRATW